MIIICIICTKTIPTYIREKRPFHRGGHITKYSTQHKVLLCFLLFLLSLGFYPLPQIQEVNESEGYSRVFFKSDSVTTSSGRRLSFLSRTTIHLVSILSFLAFDPLVNNLHLSIYLFCQYWEVDTQSRTSSGSGSQVWDEVGSGQKRRHLCLCQTTTSTILAEAAISIKAVP